MYVKDLEGGDTKFFQLLAVFSKTALVPGLCQAAARSQELCLGLPCGLQRYQGAEMEQVFEQVFYGLPASQ